MILSKKFLLVILICSVALGGLIAYVTFINSNQIINQDDLREYIRIYLDTYRRIIEPPSNLTGKEIESFGFYNNYPYSAVGVISESHGVGIQFIPESSQPYQLKEINENIEDILFPKMPKDAPDMPTAGLAFMGNQTSYANNSSFFGVGLFIGENATFIFDGVTKLSDTPIFRKGNIVLTGTLLNDKPTIIAKGSNLKKDWSKEKAEQDAIDAFFRELSNNIIAESKLKGLGVIEISSLVENYKQKEKKGGYEQNPKEKFKDRELIFETADKYGIHYDTFIQTLNKTENPSSIDNFLGIVGSISTLFSVISVIALALIIIVNKIKWNIPISQSLKDEFNELLSIKKYGKNKN